MPIVYEIHLKYEKSDPNKSSLMVYVGSTYGSLYDRMRLHYKLWEIGKNNTSAKQIFDAFGLKSNETVRVNFNKGIEDYNGENGAIMTGFKNPSDYRIRFRTRCEVDDGDDVTIYEQSIINGWKQGGNLYNREIKKKRTPPVLLNKRRAYTGSTNDLHSRSPETCIRDLFRQYEEKPKKEKEDNPENYIRYMFYQNGDGDVSVPLTMIDRHQYYLKHQREKVLAKQKARSDYCQICQHSYNQIKVHYIGDKHKKREAQLALSPISAKYIN